MSGSGCTIVGLGEVVWDLFEDGQRRLGGAPANVAYHAAALGDSAAVASRVGDDELGREAARLLADRGLDLGALQVDALRPTGAVNVRLCAGQPSFAIDPEGAWTAMEWSPPLEALLGRAQLICFGSLMLAFPAGRPRRRGAARRPP